jgi:hypothetical protein
VRHLAENSVTTAGRCTQGICRAKAQVSELTIVRGNAERDLLGPVFRPVAAKINFQIHEFSQGQVAAARFSQAFDGPRPILGRHDVRYELKVIPDRAFHPPGYRPAKSQSTWESGLPALLGLRRGCDADDVCRDCPVTALIHSATACTVATPHPGLRARSL